jgi:hypothetical protein
VVLRHLASLSLLLLLCACCSKPSSEALYQRSLQLQVRPYVNGMPGVIIGGQVPACEDLLIPFSIRASADGFPAGLNVRSVSVTNLRSSASGHVVEPRLRETYFLETLNSAEDWSGGGGLLPGEVPPSGHFVERTLRGVAVACAPSTWLPGDIIEATVQVEAGARRETLRAVRPLQFVS